MNLFQEYNKIVNKFSFLEDPIKKILAIFEGTGENQIITQDMLPSQNNIKDFTIPSEEIERGLNIIHSGLRKIQEDDAVNSAGLFYFSQYGGSKTQFLNLVMDEVNSKLPNCITILFDDLHYINPIFIFENIFSQIFRVIGQLPVYQENLLKYKGITNDLQHHIGGVQVAIRQSTNLKKAEELLERLKKIKNPEMLKNLNELDTLLHSTILVDGTKILNKVINLMQFCSQQNIMFLFLFDEVDLWLEEEGDFLKFSSEFNRMSHIMKVTLEIPDKRIKTFMVFACTDRVNKLMNTKQQSLEISSPAGTRLNRIFNASERVVEPGNYGNRISEALVKLSAFFHLANNRFKIEPKILDEILQALEGKFNNFSRRMANSKIIKILKNYHKLSQPLTRGLKSWKGNAQLFGRLIQDHLPSILSRLTIRFVRKDIHVDPSPQALTRDKIDGYFINYSLDNEEIKTHVEIKLTDNFKGDKAYQALQFLQLNKDKSCIMIIFCPKPLSEIKKEIYKYGDNQGYDKDIYKRLNYILIENQMAFAPIIGINSLSGDTEQYLEYLETFANWFEFFSNFSTQYQEIKQKLGIDVIIPPQVKKDSEGIAETPETSGQHVDDKQQKINITPDQQSCLNLITKLYHKRKFSKTGRMNKSTIQKFVEENSLGLTDLEMYYELMDRANIIEKITNSQVMFSTKIINAFSLEKLQIQAMAYFEKLNEQSSVLNKYI